MFHQPQVQLTLDNWIRDKPSINDKTIKVLIVRLLLKPDCEPSDFTCPEFKDILVYLNKEAVQRAFPDGDWITIDWIVGAYYEVRHSLPEDERIQALHKSRDWIAEADCKTGSSWD